jgi:hypothetical protein
MLIKKEIRRKGDGIKYSILRIIPKNDNFKDAVSYLRIFLFDNKFGREQLWFYFFAGTACRSGLRR